MKPTEINKYLYIERTPTTFVRVLYFIGIICYLPVLYGYWLFVQTGYFYTWFMLPPLLFVTVYYFLTYFINLFYTRPSLSKHLAMVDEYWKNHPNVPSVDIFLPICGEGVDVLENTFEAVKNIPYPNKKVYVLDDKGGEKYQTLAEKFGFNYLSRPNKGEFKKAGNLKYGFGRSNGEFIIIFDADFAPHPDFIKETVPYMQDEGVGILQTPQYFDSSDRVHRRSALEYGAAHVLEDFYRTVQVSRDRFGAPICCGSNAIYRRKALAEIGGTYQIEHSEDMYTGFKLMTRGWKVRYMPVILAVGACPSNIHQYFHQQERWSSGTLLLMLDKNFWRSNLTLAQKICFITGFMYYISYVLIIILSFQLFLILFYFRGNVSLLSTLPFIPTILFSAIILPMYRISEPRFGNFVARTAHSYAYYHSLLTTFARKETTWRPTNVKKVRVSNEFLNITIFAALYLLIYVTLIALAIKKDGRALLNLNYLLIFYWITINLASIIVILFQFYFVVHRAKKEEVKNGTISRFSFFMWRFGTFGMFFVIIGEIVAVISLMH